MKIDTGSRVISYGSTSFSDPFNKYADKNVKEYLGHYGGALLEMSEENHMHIDFFSSCP